MRRFLTAAAIVTTSLALTGCGLMRQKHVQTRDEIAANDNKICADTGLKFGSPEFAQCRMNLLGMRERIDARNGANEAAANAAAAQTLSNMGTAIINSPPVTYQPAPPMQPIGRQGVDVYHHRGF